MCEFRKNNIEKKKPDTKECKQHDSNYMNQEQVKLLCVYKIQKEAASLRGGVDIDQYWEKGDFLWLQLIAMLYILFWVVSIHV